MHGGGSASKERSQFFIPYLIKNGISFTALDFSGQGESEVDIANSSLEKRVNEANQVIQHLYSINPNIELSVTGVSMGGYIAIKMLEHWKVKNLLLFCPAIYSAKAYSIEFGGGFSGVIREKESWRNSDAPKTLSEFTGNLSNITASEDQIIPPEVIDIIYTSARNVKSKEIIKVQESSHALLTYLAKGLD